MMTSGEATIAAKIARPRVVAKLPQKTAATSEAWRWKGAIER